MSDTELPPLDADIAEMLDLERPLVRAGAAQKARAFAVVEARIAALGPGGGSSGGQAGGTSTGGGLPLAAGRAGASFGMTAAKIGAIFAVGAVVGGATVHLLEAPSGAVPPTVVYVDRGPPLDPRSAPARPDVPPIPVGELPSAPRAPVTSPASASTKAASADVSENGNARGLAAERALLDVASSALARGMPDEALEAVERHARDYPRGILVEEREAVEVKALVASGRTDEAKARATSFRARYPKSLLLSAVEAAAFGANKDRSR